MHYATGRYVLDLHPDDVFWCTADPGWVTGTSYGIIAPLLHGVTNLVDEADFDAERWYGVLRDQKVTVWYTAPTAIRRLMRIPGEPRTRYDLSALRLVHSVGEPLNPEAVVWGQQALGLPIHDNWWQTETGGIMIANFAAMDIRPGSMGRPLPGIEAAIVRRTDGGVEVITEPDVEGELALQARLALDVPRLSARRGALREVLRRRLVSERRSRDARCRRLLLVRRPRRRHHQDLRPHGRPVRGRERADGASGGRRGRRHRQAGPADRRTGEGLRRAQGRPDRRATHCAWNSSALPARASARPWRRRRSPSSTACRRRAAARSCAAC